MARTSLDSIAADLAAQTNDLLVLVDKCSDRSSLSQLLEPITQWVAADGAMVWRPAPGMTMPDDDEAGDLLLAASWFESNKQSPIRAIHRRSSVAGIALKHMAPTLVTNIWQDTRISITDPFLKNANINDIYAVPIRFVDGTVGSVNFYMRELAALPAHTRPRMRIMAGLIPHLDSQIQRRVHMGLLREIDSHLHRFVLRRSANHMVSARKPLRAVCRLVSATLNVFETSVYLSSASHREQDCALVATSVAASAVGPDPVCRRSSMSPTAWVMSHKIAIAVPDLRQLSGAADTPPEYSGMLWQSEDALDGALRRRLGRSAHILPQGFMAAPILYGGRALGAIRCLVSQRPPYHFSAGDVELLNLIASAIGYYVSLQEARSMVASENARMLALVRTVREMNKAVFADLKKAEPDEHQMFARTLDIVSDIVPDAFASDVRMLTADGKHLWFAAVHGEAWSQGGEEVARARRAQLFSLEGAGASSIGAGVYRDGRAVEVARRRKPGRDLPLFPGTRRLLVAPVGLDEEREGLLDIRRRGREPSSEATRSMVELLGDQLGLYLQLSKQMRQHRTIESQLQERQRQEAQIYQDLEHQLKSPIIQARARLEAVPTSGVAGEADIRAARGLCGRAKRVVVNIRFFRALAEGVARKFGNTLFDPERAYATALSACEDNLAMAEEYRRLRCYVDRASFGVFRRHAVYGDWDLVEQAFSNILDNAFKYCYSETSIEVRAGLTSSDRAHVSFSNRGLYMSPDVLARCRERGFRGEEAKWTTGEGSGIGLYIVDQIMKAHEGGELLIIPSNAQGRTEVKLLFAVTGRKHASAGGR